MKRIVLISVITILLCSLLTTSFGEETSLQNNLNETTDEELVQAAVGISTKIVPDQEEIIIDKGKSLKLTAAITGLPDGVAAGALTWNSADSAIATCTKNTLKAIGPGTTTVTCKTTLSDGTEISADCRVTVSVPVQGITLASKKIEIMATETFLPEFTIKPQDATNKDVIYNSADETVVKVTDDGKLLAVAAGKTTVTITAADGSKKSAKLTVTVTKKIGKYDDELTYQGLAWGSSAEECVLYLVEKEIIEDRYYAAVYSNTPVFWRENDLMFITNQMNKVPVIFENEKTGVAILDVALIKTIGGFTADPNYLSLSFINGINENGQVDKDLTKLVGVRIFFNPKHNKGTEIFKTLLAKLEAQYGAFNKYVDKDYIKYRKKQYKEVADILDGAQKYTVKDFDTIKAEETAIGNTISGNMGIYRGAVCAIHGKNNTGIAIIIYASDQVELYYGKTDAWDQLREIQRVLEANPDHKGQDGGI